MLQTLGSLMLSQISGIFLLRTGGEGNASRHHAWTKREVAKNLP